MAITLPDARQLSDEVLEALRLRAVRGCELGFTEVDVADLLGLSRETDVFTPPKPQVRYDRNPPPLRQLRRDLESRSYRRWVAAHRRRPVRRR